MVILGMVYYWLQYITLIQYLEVKPIQCHLPRCAAASCCQSSANSSMVVTKFNSE